MLLFLATVAADPATETVVPEPETVTETVEVDPQVLKLDSLFAEQIASVWVRSTVGVTYEARTPTVVVDGFATPGATVMWRRPSRAPRGETYPVRTWWLP